MSESAREQYGPPQATLTPPMNALATVVVGGSPITTLRVPADTTLGVHVESREDMNGTEWGTFDESGTDDVPEPGGSVPSEVHAETRVRGLSWVVVSLDDERRAQVSATEGDRVTVHGERDRSDEIDESEVEA